MGGKSHVLWIPLLHEAGRGSWPVVYLGAGDPLAKTWKQPEFPCNKAAVRKAQSN